MNDIQNYKEQAMHWIEEHQKEFQEISQDIWSHPELSLEEYEASKKLTAVLEKYGFRVQRGVADLPTAFVAVYGDQKPVIAFSAEYDALPELSQESGTAKKNPVKEGAPGHGCGHSILGVAEVLGAIAMKQVMEEQKLPGTVKVFGTPGEEICIGKAYMGRAGLFQGVDCFLDWHPWSYNMANYDVCSAYFSIMYHFKGKTAHGNSPWQGRSAFDAGRLAAAGIEFLREHYISASPDHANTINYTFTDVGPETPNVVSDRTSMWVVGRFTRTEEMEEVIDRVNRIFEAGALATETEVTWEVRSKTHDKIPNKTLARMIYDNFTELGTLKFTEEEQKLARQMQCEDQLPVSGLDETLQDFGTCGTVLCDTSEYSWNAPYAGFWMTAAPEGGWHSWRVASCVGSSIGMKTMVHAAKLLSCSGITVLMEPELLAEAKKEFEERMDGKIYQALIPALKEAEHGKRTEAGSICMD